MPYVIASGITSCNSGTPKSLRPPFNPSAAPCARFGKKGLMLAMEEEKLPPPIPDSKAST